MRPAVLATALLAAAAVALALFALPGAAAATTVGSQTISSDTTWTLAGSPYVVTGTVTVAGAANPALTIEPGVEVRFASFGVLHIGTGWSGGRLYANGTAAAPITFTSNAASPAPGDWNYVRLHGGGPSAIANATLEYAGRSSRSTLEVVSHALRLDDVVVRDGAWTALYVDAANPSLRNVVLERHASTALYAEADARPTLLNVTIRDNAAAPLRVRLDQDLSGVSLAQNGVRRVQMHGAELTSSLTLPVLVDGSTGERHQLHLLTRIYVRNGATLTIPAGTTMLVEPWVDIAIGTFRQAASLVAEGTAAEPISIVARAGSAADGWYGLSFRGDAAALGASVLRNVTIAHSRDDGLATFYYSGLLVDNATLRDNAMRGVLVDGGAPRFRALVAANNGWEGATWTHASPVFEQLLVEGAGRSGVYVGGCGIGTLRDATIRNTSGYGLYSDGPCNGAHLDGVLFENIGSRAWRNRIDLRHDVAIHNAAVPEVEHWGADITSDRTLPIHVDAATGREFATVIVSGVEVRNGATLTIPANSTILFADFTWLNVGTYAQRGSLRAEGTADAPITFDARTRSANGWYGLHFRGDSAPLGASLLRNVTLANSRDDAISTYHYSGLLVDNATLRDNGQRGAYVDGGSPQFRNVRATGNAWEGVTWTWASPTFRGLVIEDSGRSGVYVGGCGVGVLQDVVIRNSTGYGFFSDGPCNGAHFDGVRIEDSGSRPWRSRIDLRLDVAVSGAGIDEVEYWGATLTSDRTLARLVDEADGAPLTPVILSGFEVRGGATLTLLPGTTVLMGDGSWINIGYFAQAGALRAEGTAEQPIELRSRSGSSVNGWFGLHFRGDSAPIAQSPLRNVTVAFSRDHGIDAYHHRGLLLDNVTLRQNAWSGIRLDGTSTPMRNVLSVESGGDGAQFYWASPVWHGGGVLRSGGVGVATSGCGFATLADIVIEEPIGYGLHADGACNGAHLDGVRFVDVARPWRNRIDVRLNATIEGSGVDEVEYWGASLTSNRTLPLHRDLADGATVEIAILSSFEVRNGATLAVPAGATVRMNDGVEIRIGTFAQQGHLLAEGTEAEPIRFLGRSGAATHGWYGFYFRGDSAPESRTILRNATIAHSRDHAIDAYHYRGFVLDNVTIHRNAGNGLSLWGAAPGPALVKSAQVTRNGDNGIFAYQGQVVIVSSNVSDNGGDGIEMYSSGVARVTGTLLHDNLGAGVNLTGGSPKLVAQGNVFWANRGFGVDLQGASGSTIVDNAFIRNGAGQARASGMHTWNLTKTPGENIAGGAFLGGNAWSDYAGADTDGDGLGDTLAYATGLGPGADALPLIGGMFADFVVSIPDVVNAPRVLLFQDATLGGVAAPTSWAWQFGDGATATGREALHEYAWDGTYEVTLTVWNDRGQTASVTREVIVDSDQPLSQATLDGTLGEDGWYVSAVDVTLTATDELAGIDAIRWRLDGGAFANYEGPIRVWDDGVHVLEHFAIDNNGNTGPTFAVSFRVDRTAPDVGAVLNGTEGLDGWYLSDVAVSLSVADPTSGLVRFEAALGEANLTEDAREFAITEDGEHLVRWRATDAAGNVAEGSLTVRRDATLPTLTGHESGPVGGTGWYVGPVTVNLTGDDATSGLLRILAQVDGGAWFEVTGPFDIEGEGVHTLNVTASDAAGNVLDVPARAFRIGAGTPVATMSLEAVLAADGWHRADAAALVAGEALPVPPVEGRLEAPNLEPPAPPAPPALPG